MTMTPNDGSPWVEDIEFVVPRFLEGSGSNTTDSNSSQHLSDSSQTIRASLRVYGSIFACGFTVYCYLRKRIPRTYAVRQWAPHCKTPLAEDQFGYISWLWKVYSFSTDELRETIGLDALCFLRLMNMGFRLACVGAFNSIWLFPVYATAEKISNAPEDENVVVVVASVQIIKEGGSTFVATVVAAYIFFGYTMHTILKEFRWFITQRHIWLKRFNQRNYTILVRNIPEELRSDQLLLQHFQRLYGAGRGKKLACYARSVASRANHHCLESP